MTQNEKIQNEKYKIQTTSSVRKFVILRTRIVSGYLGGVAKKSKNDIGPAIYVGMRCRWQMVDSSHIFYRTFFYFFVFNIRFIS